MVVRDFINTMVVRRPPRRRKQTRNGGPTMMAGDRIRFNTPDNPRMNGTMGTITETTDWGAHCFAPGAATGRYRATWDEMETIPVEYTGDMCQFCGGVRMRRTGTCKVCEDCGESGGCG